MTEKEFEHSVDAKLDYGFDWQKEGWLEVGETISTSTWNVGTLSPSSPQNTGTITSVFVEGAVLNARYKLVNTVTTSMGRRDSRTISLFCKQR
jgi:hypothetical protein